MLVGCGGPPFRYGPLSGIGGGGPACGPGGGGG